MERIRKNANLSYSSPASFADIAILIDLQTTRNENFISWGSGENGPEFENIRTASSLVVNGIFKLPPELKQ